jgi:hypothetical protein
MPDSTRADAADRRRWSQPIIGRRDGAGRKATRVSGR